MLAGPELAAIRRHVIGRLVESTVNMDLVAGMAAMTDEVVNSLPVGPPEESRRASRFTILAEAQSGNGEQIRGYVSGNDVYNSTATIVVEAAIQLANGRAPKGAVSPSEAFDAASFLDALKQIGIKWSVEN